MIIHDLNIFYLPTWKRSYVDRRAIINAIMLISENQITAERLPCQCHSSYYQRLNFSPAYKLLDTQFIVAPDLILSFSLPCYPMRTFRTMAISIMLSA